MLWSGVHLSVCFCTRVCSPLGLRCTCARSQACALELVCVQVCVSSSVSLCKHAHMWSNSVCWVFVGKDTSRQFTQCQVLFIYK